MKKEQFEKNRLLNLILYFSSNLEGQLSLVKLNKLLYFFDISVFKETGLVPTGLRYCTEENGPAPKSLNDAILHDDTKFFNDSISFEVENKNCKFSKLEIISSDKFDEDYFSDDHISILASILSKFGNKSAEELSDLTHRESTPYTITVEENNGAFGNVIDFRHALEPGDVTKDFVDTELGYEVGDC